MLGQRTDVVLDEGAWAFADVEGSSGVVSVHQQRLPAQQAHHRSGKSRGRNTPVGEQEAQLTWDARNDRAISNRNKYTQAVAARDSGTST